MQTTRPMSLAPTQPRRSLADMLQAPLNYAKYGVAGALAAIAVLKTAHQYDLINLTNSLEIAWGVLGALAMIGIAGAVRSK